MVFFVHVMWWNSTGAIVRAVTADGEELQETSHRGVSQGPAETTCECATQCGVRTTSVIPFILEPKHHYHPLHDHLINTPP